MKFFATFFFTCIISTSIFAQVTRSSSEVVSANDVSTMNLNLNSDNIEIKETKGTRIIIESHITLESISNATLLEFLINSGRYSIANKFNATTHTLDIARKKNTNVLLVKGEECKESIRYVILVPSSVKFVNTSSATASK